MEIAASVESEVPSAFNRVGSLLERARVLATAPLFSAAALTASCWENQQTEISSLLWAGAEFGRSSSELSEHIVDGAVELSVEGLGSGLAELPSDFPKEGFVRARQLTILFPRRSAAILLGANLLRLMEFGCITWRREPESRWSSCMAMAA